MTAVQRHQQTGAWHRIQRIPTPEYPIGATTYVKAHGCDGGITIGKGKNRIMLDADETARLIDAAQKLTTPPRESR
jgi:hypothetical protein